MGGFFSDNTGPFGSPRKFGTEQPSMRDSFLGQSAPPQPSLFGSAQPSLRELLLGQPAPRNPFVAGMTQGSMLGSMLGPTPVVSPFVQTTQRYSAIHRGFEECLTRIELDSTRIQLAKQHYNAVKSWLQSRLDVEVRRVGSFRKHTKIRPRVVNGKSFPIDIDARVCFGDATHFLPSGQTGITGDGLLQQLRNALIDNKTYHLMQPTIDRPTVTLSYADEFSIELTPCMRNRIPPDNSRFHANFLLWNNAGNLEINDYDYDCAFITELNRLHDGCLIPAMKLIKQFVRNQDIQLKSFQVELLCIDVLSRFLSQVKEAGSSWEWQDLIICFLELGPVALGADLRILGSRTTPTRISNVSQIQLQLRYFAALAVKIRELGDTADAYQLWRAFYGEPFPASIT